MEAVQKFDQPQTVLGEGVGYDFLKEVQIDSDDVRQNHRISKKPSSTFEQLVKRLRNSIKSWFN
jgi:hypothetical protein